MTVYSQDMLQPGVVKDSLTGLPLHGAHIQNHTSQTLATSRADGTFDIPAHRGDTLVVTFVGYEEFSYVLEVERPDTLLLLLKPSEIVLEDVVITPFPEYEQFKQMILSTEPAPDSLLRFDLPLLSPDYFYDPRNAPVGTPQLAAPTVGFSFDLEGLTKRGKQKKKLSKLIKEQALWTKASLKVNRNWISAETKLEGDELTDFIAFCNFTPEYIIKTPMYEIHGKLMALLEEFLSRKQQHDVRGACYHQKASLIPA